jgi:hypothetical protein
MRLSREKIVHLSHLITEFIEKDDKVKFVKNKNDVRLLIQDTISREMKRDEIIDMDIRKQMNSMKANIPEGSPDWDALYHKMYQDALDRPRKGM